MSVKESLKVYYIIAPEDPKRSKKPYQKFDSLSDAFLSGDLYYPSKNALYCLSEYTKGKSKTQYDIYQIFLEKLTGDRLDNFLKAGLNTTSN